MNPPVAHQPVQLGQDQLGVPAPHVCSFRDLFSQGNRDPLSGSYEPLFSPFNIDINNVNNSTSSLELWDLIAATGAQRQLLALAILNNNTIRVYLCPQRFERSLGSPPSDLDNRLFAFDGDLFHNQGHTVACRPFVRFFQIAITRQAENQGSPLEIALPAVPPRNLKLLEARHQLIQCHFPQMNPSLIGIQQNQIAQQLVLIRQHDQNRLQDEARR